MKDVEFADRFSFREGPAAVRNWPKGWKGAVADEVAEAAEVEGKLVGPKGGRAVEPKDDGPKDDEPTALGKRLDAHTVAELKALYGALELPEDALPKHKADIITAILAGAAADVITAALDAAAVLNAGGAGSNE